MLNKINDLMDCIIGGVLLAGFMLYNVRPDLFGAAIALFTGKYIAENLIKRIMH